MVVNDDQLEYGGVVYGFLCLFHPLGCYLSNFTLGTRAKLGDENNEPQ